MSGQDLEAMAKWTSFQIVHYKAVGEYSGEVLPDKKSLVFPPGKRGATNEGWAWTYTPTGVT